MLKNQNTANAKTVTIIHNASMEDKNTLMQQKLMFCHILILFVNNLATFPLQRILLKQFKAAKINA